MKNSGKIVLAANDNNITEQTINLETGKMETITYNTLAILKALEIHFILMPNYTLREAKGEKESLKLSQLGTYCFFRLDNENHIVNEYGGRNLRRPLIVDMATILDLRSLLIGNGKEFDPKMLGKKS